MIDSSLIKRTLTYLKENGIEPEGNRFILAVSGGADSVFMAYLFKQISEIIAMDLFIFHVNHNVRGAESLSDECFVRKLSENLKLPFFSISLTPSVIPKIISEN
jgi:tRNA(Ile)-lysidine synthase